MTTGMRLGITFPQYELDPGRAPVVAFAEAVRESGFGHLVLYDHVLGVDVASHPKFRGPYASGHQFHEVLVLFGFLAALVDVELVSSVLILPQRSAVLVAKQAAEVDVLSGGRIRLGVGMGWNRRELLALGEQWEGRGARFAEQIELMRLLWTQDVVHFEGRFHTIEGLGILPRPIQQPIPVWMGGGGFGAGHHTFDRIGRLADGWLAGMVFDRDAEEIIQVVGSIREAAAAAGRPDDALEIEGLVQVSRDLDLASIEHQIEQWAKLGATRITLRTLDVGLSADEHLQAVRQLGKLMGVT